MNVARVSAVDRGVATLVGAQAWPLVGRFARLLLRFAFGVDVPHEVRIGTGLKLVHATTGVVIHPRTRLGDHVTLFHNVTIGRSDPWVSKIRRDDPVSGVVVEDHAILGAGAVVLFREGQQLEIGEGAVVGANSVVTRSVPAGQVWAGSPAVYTGERTPVVSAVSVAG